MCWSTAQVLEQLPTNKQCLEQYGFDATGGNVRGLGACVVVQERASACRWGRWAGEAASGTCPPTRSSQLPRMKRAGHPS